MCRTSSSGRSTSLTRSASNTQESKDMTGRTAIVTGAARGIGAETARRLAQDGLSVAVTDLRQDECDAVAESIVSAGGTAFPLALDVSDERVVQDAVATIADELGPPTVL